MAKSPPGRPGGQPGGVGSWLLGPWPIRQDTRNSHSQSREVSLAGRSAPPDASGQPCGSRSFVTCRRLRSGRAWRRRWPAAGRTNRCPGPDDAEHDGEDDGAAHGRADHEAASRGRRCAGARRACSSASVMSVVATASPPSLASVRRVRGVRSAARRR